MLFKSVAPRFVDPRILDDRTKVPQVFRVPGGNRALQNERPMPDTFRSAFAHHLWFQASLSEPLPSRSPRPAPIVENA